MELELGLKITRTLHDFASTSDFWFPNDGASPRFVSKETDAAIVLTGYLKGYRSENINIKINEHGTRIVIGGEKPVQEMIMMGWIMLKKQVETREFRKVFRIPEGIVLNRIKAKFNLDGSVLTIHFPKLIKGISGIVIDEEPEEPDGRILHQMESSGIVDEILLNKKNEQISSVRIAEDNIREKQAELIEKSIETTEETNEYHEKVEESTIAGANADQNDKDLVAEMESREAAREITDASINIPDSNDHQRETHEAIDEKEEGQGQATMTAESAIKEAENENDEGEIQKERKLVKEIENNRTISSSKPQEKMEASEEEQTEETQKIVQQEQKDRKKEQKVEKKTCNSFVIAGSALLASSLIVIVLGFVRAKRKDKK